MTMVIWRRFMIGLMLVFTLMLAATPVALADPGTSVAIGSAADVPVGDSVDVDITINTDNTDGISAAFISLTVDTAVVNITGVVGGDLGSVEWNPTTGIMLAAYGGIPAPTGDILFATVTLTAVGDYEDCSNLDITVMDLYNGATVPQLITPSPITDGTFCIQTNPSPTPVTPTPSPTPVTPTPSPTPSPTPVPGNVSYIVIDPATRSITTGRTREYTAEAFDGLDSSLGDITGGTTFGIEAGAGGSWANNVYTSDNVGTWTVTGTYLSFSDTATLTVRSASSGGGGGGGGGGVTTQTFTVLWDGVTTTASMTTSGQLLESVSVMSADGLNELEMRAGTITLDGDGEVVDLIEVTEVTAPSLPAGTAVVGQAFDFGPGTMTFSKPVGITLGYTVTDLPDDTIALNMVHFTSDGSSYEIVETEDSQTAELGFLIGQADSFSVYAILADIPAFEVSELSIVPSRHETWGFPTFTAREGEEALITADVTNTGNYEATYTASLKVNGETVDSQTITLAPDQSGQVEFTISDMETGDYEIALGDQSTTFESFFWINWLLIGIIIAILILLALLVGLLFARRNKTVEKPA